MGAFCPPTYMLKHVSLRREKNGSKSSCKGILLNNRSPKSSFTLKVPTLLPMKEIFSNEEELVDKKEVK